MDQYLPFLAQGFRHDLNSRFGESFLTCTFENRLSYNVLANTLRGRPGNTEPVCTIHVSEDYFVREALLPGREGVFYLPLEGYLGIVEGDVLIFTVGFGDDNIDKYSTLLCSHCERSLTLGDFQRAQRNGWAENFPQWTGKVYCSAACVEDAQKEYSTDLATDATIQSALQDEDGPQA